jgi:hypothetical protein
MSTTALIDSPVPGSEGNAAELRLDWLLAMLKQSMEEVMASDAKPLQKASALARLGNLFLKTYGAAGLAKENKALKRRLAEMEELLAGASRNGAAQPATAVDPTRAGASPASRAVVVGGAGATPSPRHSPARPQCAAAAGAQRAARSARGSGKRRETGKRSGR